MKKQAGIFSWTTDSSRYIHKDECSDFTPPFISYVPIGTPTQNVDIESDLRGSNRLVSRCVASRYSPPSLDLVQGTTQAPNPNNKIECSPKLRIINNGYTHLLREANNKK